MNCETYALIAAPQALKPHFCNGIVIQAPSTNSQTAYYGVNGAVLMSLAPNTSVVLPNVVASEQIEVKGTANDKLNVLFM